MSEGLSREGVEKEYWALSNYDDDQYLTQSI